MEDFKTLKRHGIVLWKTVGPLSCGFTCMEFPERSRIDHQASNNSIYMSLVTSNSRTNSCISLTSLSYSQIYFFSGISSLYSGCQCPQSSEPGILVLSLVPHSSPSIMDRLASSLASIPSLSHCSQDPDYLWEKYSSTTPYLLCGLSRIYPALIPDGAHC